MQFLRSLSRLLPWNQVDPRAEESRRAHQFETQKGKVEIYISQQMYPKAQELIEDLRDICKSEGVDEGAEREKRNRIARLEQFLEETKTGLGEEVRKAILSRDQDALKKISEQQSQLGNITDAMLELIKQLYEQPDERTQSRLAELDRLQESLNRSRNRIINKVIIPGIVEKADLTAQQAAKQRGELVVDTADMQQIAQQTGQKLGQCKQELQSLADKLYQETDQGQIDRIKRRMNELRRFEKIYENANKALASKQLEIYEEFQHYRHGIHEHQDAINDIADIQGILETDLRSDFPAFYYLLTRHREHVEISYDVLGKIGKVREAGAQRELKEARQEAEELKARIEAQQDEILGSTSRLDDQKRANETLRVHIAQLEKDKERIRTEATDKIKGISDEARKRIAVLKGTNTSLESEVAQLKVDVSGLIAAQQKRNKKERHKIFDAVVEAQEKQSRSVEAGESPLQHYYYGFIILEACRRIRNARGAERDFSSEIENMVNEKGYKERYFDEAGRRAVARYNFYREGKISYEDAKSAKKFKVEWLRPFQAKILRDLRDDEHPCQSLVLAILAEREVRLERLERLEQRTWCALWDDYPNVLEGRNEKRELQEHLRDTFVLFQKGMHPHQAQIENEAKTWGWSRSNMEDVTWFRMWVKVPCLLESSFRLDRIVN